MSGFSIFEKTPETRGFRQSTFWKNFAPGAKTLENTAFFAIRPKKIAAQWGRKRQKTEENS
jgi:hypothetical protein